MAEIRVKDNESLDSALRRSKNRVRVPACLQKSARESITRSRLYGAKRNPKLHANGNTNNPRVKADAPMGGASKEVASFCFGGKTSAILCQSCRFVCLLRGVCCIMGLQ